MAEVQNVGALDAAQYQPSQYQQDNYVEEYSTQPQVYDEKMEEMRAASRSRLGATLLTTAVIGGLAVWGGHAWGKRAANAEIEKAKDAIQKYGAAKEAMDKVEKLAVDGNDCFFGSNHCGNNLLKSIKDLFKPFKNEAENSAKDGVDKAADDLVRAAEDAVK